MENPPFRPALFWDVDIHALDSVKHATFVIKRILARGDVADFSWAKRNYTLDAIRDVVLSDRELDAKSANYWYNYFGIDPRICIQKQSVQRQGLFWKR